ncbi:heterokaryon incompatibility protein-domain-containing protein, partial [Xylogone sp. PMI_703]
MSTVAPTASLYSALASVDEIRLLHLEPTSSLDDTSVRCTLKHVRLSAKPRYEALSYMWGPKSMKLIELNGVQCEVRENLWQALIHLRETNSTRIIWIDAVCINQNDIEERNSQVSQMGAIYRKAWRVVTWLGPEDPSTELGVWALNNHTKYLSQSISEHWINQLKAVKNLCDRGYWTRLWIIQEVLSA